MWFLVNIGPIYTFQSMVVFIYLVLTRNRYHLTVLLKHVHLLYHQTISQICYINAVPWKIKLNYALHTFYDLYINIWYGKLCGFNK